MSSLPVCRAALSAPFLQFLDEHDRDPSVLLKNFNVDRDTLVNPKLYLPSHLLGHIVASTASATQCNYIGFHAAQYVDNRGIHPQFQEQLLRSEGVTDLLNVLLSLQHLQGSHFKLWLEYQNGEMRICHQSSLKATSKGYEHSNEFTAFIIINQLKRQLGETWQPKYLAFHHLSAPKAKIVGQTAEKKVFYGTKHNYVPVDIDMRDMEPMSLFPKERPSCSITRVKGVIDTFWQSESFGIDFVAQLFGVSERTLQRLFIQHDTSFRDYLNQKKVERSLKLLQQGLSVQDVAEKLNYSDPSNFSRAMKKHLNMTPTQYLKQVAQVA